MADAQTPVGRQYYYRVDGCPALRSSSPGCICWHDAGTGPRRNAPEGSLTWREPQPDRAVMQQALDALRDLEAMAERYRPSGYPVPDAQKMARAAIAALSATMEKPNAGD